MATFGVAHTDNPEAGKRRLLKGFLDGIAASQSIRQERVAFADDSRPVRDRSGLPLISHGLVLLSVIGLNLRRGPAAISRLIGAIYVNAIESASVWAWPHVTQERPEIVSPCIAHHDAASTIQRVFVVVHAIATGLGAFPCAMFFAAGTAMRRIERHYAVTAPTPATLGVSMSQFPLSRHHGASALTDAFPIAVMAPCWRSLYDGQAREYLACQVSAFASHVRQFTTENPSVRGK